MANVFTKAFRRAFSRIVGADERAPKPESGWDRVKRVFGDWRERAFTPSKPKSARPSPTKKQRRELVEESQFKIETREDPAFYSWVNRVAANWDVRPQGGETLTEARLRAIMEQVGVSTELELYEYVKDNPEFGYDEFKAAYEKYGKAVSNKENPYALNSSIEMAFVFRQIANQDSIYAAL